MAEPEASTGGKAVPERAEWLVTELLERAIAGVGPFAGAEQIAEELVGDAEDVEQAIERLIRTHVRLAAGSGFVTSLGGFLTLPVSVPAGVGGLYLIATRMCAAIAHLRGYDVHSEEVRSAIMLCLLGSAGTEVLKNAGVQIGTKSTMAALRRLPGRVLVEINKKVGFRLVTKFGQRGVINLAKLVPAVGGVIGATVDGVGCRSIAVYAKSTFPAVDRGRPAPIVVESRRVER
ncbi:MAG: hypothetical protein GEV09_04170 [Pseudonocardiaceae bacterium]|nr:hypothetical protein [Pseudonocardiaceae bacterium]